MTTETTTGLFNKTPDSHLWKDSRYFTPPTTPRKRRRLSDRLDGDLLPPETIKNLLIPLILDLDENTSKKSDGHGFVFELKMRAMSSVRLSNLDNASPFLVRDADENDHKIQQTTKIMKRQSLSTISPRPLPHNSDWMKASIHFGPHGFR